MELRVGGNEVYLSMHSDNVCDDKAGTLQQVSKFKPLVDYLTKFHPTEFSIAAMTVRNVRWVAQRIVSVVVDVKFTGKNRQSMVRSVLLSEETIHVVLPVLVVGDKSYAVLLSSPHVLLGGANINEAFSGIFLKDGTFECEYAELLKRADLHVTDRACTALTAEDVSLDSDRSVRLMQFPKVLTQREFAATFSDAGLPHVGDASLVVCPLSEVTSKTTDLKALLAASMILAKQS